MRPSKNSSFLIEMVRFYQNVQGVSRNVFGYDEGEGIRVINHLFSYRLGPSMEKFTAVTVAPEV